MKQTYDRHPRKRKKGKDLRLWIYVKVATQEDNLTSGRRSESTETNYYYCCYFNSIPLTLLVFLVVLVFVNNSHMLHDL